MKTPIDTSWNHPSKLKRNLRCVIRDLKKIQKKAKELRNIHLIKRASAMNIVNKSSSEKTILNIQKIEQVITIWRKIKYLTVTSARTNLKIIDIPTDTSVQWNDIKSTKNLQFTTIDDPILIYQLIEDRNAKYLNQADGTPFTVELLLSLVVKDTCTTFS